MEAEKLVKKKINKGKLKKTIKNVLCRPDPVFWPTVPEEQENMLAELLRPHRVHIPVFTKPHWKELRSIPKEQRPKQPKIEKPNSLIFGINDCAEAITKAECTAVLIEAAVNPRTIIEPVLEACCRARVPVLCMNGLRKISTTCFGFPTTCLGIKKDFLSEISDNIHEFAKDKLPKVELTDSCEIKDLEMCENLDTKPAKTVNIEPEKMEIQESVYLYRKSKKTRAFIPPLDEKVSDTVKGFAGQDFIEFMDKNRKQPKTKFMKMMVKRMANNPNRIDNSKKVKNK